ncbi:MAG: T9SS type A sorting domain-containing protein [Sphingobacteriales bacterium]|nr:MAG: T9SS type A sorting domain-containing protein [Sphingobacteriales bacterium]
MPAGNNGFSFVKNIIMKNNFLSIIATLTLMGGTATAQWQIQHSAPSSGIEDIQVFGSDTLFAATQWSEGFLLRSYDGGSSTDSIYFPNVSMLRHHFINSYTGFIAGYSAFSSGNSLYKTSNAGTSWQEMNLNIGGGTQHFQIHFTGSTTGFVSIENILYQTSDGGNTFSSRELISEPHYISNIHFINPQTGFVSLVRIQTNGEIYRDMIFRTSDGGATWQSVYSEQPPAQVVFVYPGISNMQFVNPQTGYAVASGTPSFLLKTGNGGQNWDTLPTPVVDDFKSLTDVHFITEQTGYITTGQHILKTNDGGQSWQQQNITPAGNYYTASIEMVNENLGYVSGHGIFKTVNGGGTVGINPSKASSLNIKVYPNPCTDELNIQKPADLIIEAFSITDIAGKVLQSKMGAATKINTGMYAKGNYWLQLHTQRGSTTIPFIVQ